MIPIIFFIHDPFHIIRPDFTSFLLTETQLSITSSNTPSTFSLCTISLPSSYWSKHPIWAILSFSKRLFSLLSHRPWSCFLVLIFMLLYLLLFSTVPFQHIALCASFTKLPPSPLHSTSMYLLHFSPSSHLSSLSTCPSGYYLDNTVHLIDKQQQKLKLITIYLYTRP